MVPQKFGFSKLERLSGKKNIEELFQQGSSFRLQHFVIRYRFLPLKSGHHRILISVPKRQFKRAVDRNLLKRRIREAYRLNKGLLPLSDVGEFVIGFIYISKSILAFHTIQDQLIKALARLNEIREKKSHEEKD